MNTGFIKYSGWGYECESIVGHKIEIKKREVS
jgi:hypothetical protein